MTIEARIEDFREVVADKMQTPDSSGWSKRLIFHHLQNARAQLLWRKVKDKKQKLSQHIFQTIPCIPLERVPASECPCEPEGDCVFLKTVTPIPHPIGPLAIVTSPDHRGMIEYSYMDWEKFKYRQNSRYPQFSKTPYYTLRNEGSETYLYTYNNIFKKHITISGVFEDTLEVAFYPDCKGKSTLCPDPLKQPFLVDADLVAPLYAMTFQMLVQIKSSMKTDINQDHIDDQKAPATK